VRIRGCPATVTGEATIARSHRCGQRQAPGGNPATRGASVFRGGGPGAPDLLTLRAVQAIALVTDRQDIFPERSVIFRPESLIAGVGSSRGGPGAEIGQLIDVTVVPGVTAALAEFDPGLVDMHTLVVVGSSRTRVIGGRMVTPRDYRWAEP